jgi:hypothetical protein
VAIDSRAHFAEAASLESRALASGSSADLVAAAEAYERAVRSHVPFASRGAEALARIEACGDALAARGERQHARRVWQEGVEAATHLALAYAPYRRQALALRQRLDRTAETP